MLPSRPAGAPAHLIGSASDLETVQHLLQEGLCLDTCPMLETYIAACIQPKDLETIAGKQFGGVWYTVAHFDTFVDCISAHNPPTVKPMSAHK